MKIVRFTPPLVCALFIFSALASAQPRFDVYFGMGTAQDGSTNQSVDLLSTGTPLPTSSMGGVFGTLGGGVMINPSFGAGAEVSFRFKQANYAGLGYRPIFYDFNGIWTPSLPRHILPVLRPELQAGVGGLNLRFYGGDPLFNFTTGSFTNFAGSSNHFQLHAGVGLRVYVKHHIFVRPQLDYHWVNNLEEFRSNSVPEFSLAIGYSSSER